MSRFHVNTQNVTNCTSYVLHTSIRQKCSRPKVSQLYCLGRLVSKIEKAIHLLDLLGKTSQ